MKKTIFTVITVATFIAFTACSKNVEQPSANRNATSSVSSGNTSNIIKKGYTGGTGTSDSTKTTTNP